MQSLLSFCTWLQNTPLSTSIRESQWVFPIIETTHVLALSLSVGLILTVDLRLAGLIYKRERASDISHQLLPWALAGFVIMIITGIFLFISMPLKCYHSVFFTVKMVFLVLSGLNAVIFHSTIYHSMDKWDLDVVPPTGARVAGILSLLFWAAVIVAGRTMAYKF